MSQALLKSGLGQFRTVGLPLLHHSPSLVDVTIGNKAFNLPNAVKLNYIN
jgi:hypothetical protein